MIRMLMFPYKYFCSYIHNIAESHIPIKICTSAGIHIVQHMLQHTHAYLTFCKYKITSTHIYRPPNQPTCTHRLVAKILYTYTTHCGVKIRNQPIYEYMQEFSPLRGVFFEHPHTAYKKNRKRKCVEKYVNMCVVGLGMHTKKKKQAPQKKRRNGFSSSSITHTHTHIYRV